MVVNGFGIVNVLCKQKEKVKQRIILFQPCVPASFELKISKSGKKNVEINEDKLKKETEIIQKKSWN